MKRLLLVLSLGGAGLWLAPTAHAQRTDSTGVKPQLNTAPPGAVPRPAPQQPVNSPQPTVPVPQPIEAPLPSGSQYDPNRPSGLDLPNRPGVAAPPPPLRKYFLYSNFGLGYSSVNESGLFNASIGPALGYQVNERFAFGPGFSYVFNNYSFPDYFRQAGYPSNLSLHSFGLKAFAQYRVVSQFFVHAEYEVTRAQAYGIRDNINTQQVEIFKVNRTYQTPLAGVGYRQDLGERVAADILVLYNFNDGIDAYGNRTSPYSQPVIRFNFLYRLGH
ncbi:hypothetical protein SAMN06265337_0892 [Hymenobacter gelipurpurascens]|uniref:Outer membrane protein beta-barrel domain-containing protein n=1 Tax=Hymenobacter gelipurpurascens TaxID=89968 RepID=A0A212TBZ0_9BACT|nr:hypothetical protein [Hymenobacter gelipurpurascens]SNC63515.1 hypothetical protein SAMN06265337_0892 [Hymenobacter gelipurpurascens]